MDFRIFEDPVAELVLWATIGAILIAVLAYIIGKIRAESTQQEPGASELMSKFRDLHSKGELSDAEFRTIKTALAARMQEELKDNGDTG
ncbi:MAG: hypothetical protein ABIK89_23465 [Planctomycetota bacterium]